MELMVAPARPAAVWTMNWRRLKLAPVARFRSLLAMMRLPWLHVTAGPCAMRQSAPPFACRCLSIA